MANQRDFNRYSADHSKSSNGSARNSNHAHHRDHVNGSRRPGLGSGSNHRQQYSQDGRDQTGNKPSYERHNSSHRSGRRDDSRDRSSGHQGTQRGSRDFRSNGHQRDRSRSRSPANRDLGRRRDRSPNRSDIRRSYNDASESGRSPRSLGNGHHQDVGRTRENSTTSTQESNPLSISAPSKLTAQKKADASSQVSTPASSLMFKSHVNAGTGLKPSAASKLASEIKPTGTTAMDTDDVSPVEEPAPKVETVEEKRQRWNAIMAKHKGTGLHANSLQGSPATPASSFNDVVATPGSAASPGENDLNEAKAKFALANLQQSSALDYKGEDDERVQEVVDEQPFLMPATAESATTKRASKLDVEIDETDDMFADTFQVKPEELNKEVSRAHMIDKWDDKDGFYIHYGNETIQNGRYVLKSVVGKGSYAQVFKAVDHKSDDEVVAIKMMRRGFRESEIKELHILNLLGKADAKKEKRVVHLREQFKHHSHLALVFPFFGKNLREILQSEGRKDGLHVSAISSWAGQIFQGLAFIHREGLVHADIKPDNLLANGSEIKICDFGTVLEPHEIHPELTMIGSRYYRAPDVILGTKFDGAIDVWAAACTLYELSTTKILFNGATNNQMLRQFQECRGAFNHSVLRLGKATPEHFEQNLDNFISEELAPGGKEIVTRLIRFTKPDIDIKKRLLLSQPAPLSRAEKQGTIYLGELLDRCLMLDGRKRPTAYKAFSYPFIEKRGEWLKIK